MARPAEMRTLPAVPHRAGALAGTPRLSLGKVETQLNSLDWGAACPEILPQHHQYYQVSREPSHLLTGMAGSGAFALHRKMGQQGRLQSFQKGTTMSPFPSRQCKGHSLCEREDTNKADETSASSLKLLRMPHGCKTDWLLPVFTTPYIVHTLRKHHLLPQPTGGTICFSDDIRSLIMAGSSCCCCQNDSALLFLCLYSLQHSRCLTVN